MQVGAEGVGGGGGQGGNLGQRLTVRIKAGMKLSPAGATAAERPVKHLGSQDRVRSRIYQHGGISPYRGTLSMSQNSIVLLTGTPIGVPPVFGNPHKCSS